MTQFWTTLTDRERMMIAIGAIVIGLSVIYMGVLTPLQNWRDDRVQGRQTAERNFELVKEAASRRPLSTTDPDGVDAATPARNAVLQSSERAGVSLQFVNVLEDGAVTTNASAVAPDALFEWVERLEQGYGIAVTRADIAREADNPDLLRVQLTLARL